MGECAKQCGGETVKMKSVVQISGGGASISFPVEKKPTFFIGVTGFTRTVGSRVVEFHLLEDGSIFGTKGSGGYDGRSYMLTESFSDLLWNWQNGILTIDIKTSSSVEFHTMSQAAYYTLYYI